MSDNGNNDAEAAATAPAPSSNPTFKPNVYILGAVNGKEINRMKRNFFLKLVCVFTFSFASSNLIAGSFSGSSTSKDAKDHTFASPTTVNSVRFSGMADIWNSILPYVINDGGFIDIENFEKVFGVKYQILTNMPDGNTFATFDNKNYNGLSVRLENSKNEGYKKARYRWMEAQIPPSVGPSEISVLNFSCIGGSQISLAHVHADLLIHGFTYQGDINFSSLSPRVEIFSKFDGLERVFIYYEKSINSAAEVSSINLVGFRLTVKSH